MTFLGNKRGILDLFVFLVIVFILAIVIIVLYIIISNIRAGADPLLNNAVSSQVLEASESAIGIMDYTYMITLVMLIISLIISMIFIRSHPVFLFVSLILVVILIVLAAVLSNTFEEFTSTGEAAVAAEHFPITLYFVGKLPLVVLVAAVLGLIALMAKPWERSTSV